MVGPATKICISAPHTLIIWNTFCCDCYLCDCDQWVSKKYVLKYDIRSYCKISAQKKITLFTLIYTKLRIARPLDNCVGTV